MKRIVTLIFLLAFAIAGYSQAKELKTEYYRTTTENFEKYLTAPVLLYFADSAKTYLLLQDQISLRNMQYVFNLGSAYYKQVTGGATLEAEVNALLDSINDHRADIETNLTALLRLNERAVHDPDTTYIYKYPLMAVVEYQPSVYPGDTGAHPRTISLGYDRALIPDNAIITEVIMDIYSHLDSDDDTATWKFMLPTDGDLTIANIEADSSNEGVYRGWPGIWALDGAALSDTLMADSMTNNFIKTTAARDIQFWCDDTITAGIVRCFVKYVVSSEYSAP